MSKAKRILFTSLSAAVLLLAGAGAYAIVGIRNDARETKEATVGEVKETGAKVREKIDAAADATKRGTEKVKDKYEDWKTKRAEKKAAKKMEDEKEQQQSTTQAPPSR